MTPDKLASSIINEYHAERITNAGLRPLLIKALEDYGKQRFKEGLKRARIVLVEIEEMV